MVPLTARAQSQGGAPSSRRNSASLTPNTAPSQSPPHNSSLWTSGDGWDYGDTGPSITPTNPRQYSGDVSSADESADPGRFAGELRATILEKAVGGNRATLPDEFNRANGTLADPNSQPNAPAAATPPGRKRRNFLGVRHSSITGRVPRSADDTLLLKVGLHWSRESIGGIEKVSLTACIPKHDASRKSENSVLWQHSKYENIRLKELEALLSIIQLHGLQESEQGLTRRLINWIGLVSQRSFVHGSYLNPTALRYDMLDDSRYNKDRCSIFIGFPYFFVRKPEAKQNTFSKGAPEHPLRTLLQSRYRLNETTERDEAQCLSELTGAQLKSCITAPHSDTAHLTQQKVEELIYVPQLWTLIIGLNRVITAGPIGDTALYGSNLMLNKSADDSGVAHKCSFVRISFNNRSVQESQIYPINQCASWFGLLNIHQQLRSALKQGKGNTVPKDFKLRIGDHVLTDTTWSSVQRLAQAEVLNIWMDTPVTPMVSVGDADANTTGKRQEAQFSDTESLHQTIPPPRTATSTIYKNLDPVPVKKPFLHWDILDDFGNRDESKPEVKVNRFLSAIYHSLYATCVTPSAVSAPQAAQIPQTGRDSDQRHEALSGQNATVSQYPQGLATFQGGSTDQRGPTASLVPQPGQTPPTDVNSEAGQSAQATQIPAAQASHGAKPSILVLGRTSKDVDDLTYELQQQVHKGDPFIEQEFRQEAVKLFSYYIPQTAENETLAPVRLFWGLLYELIEHRQHLQTLYKKICDINDCAQRLHLGVYCELRVLDDTGIETLKEGISDHAILQAAMIDALGDIFSMLVAAVQESRSHSPDSKVEPWRRALRHGEEARKLLIQARDRLIAEATGSVPGKDLGPVITPEAIMIVLFERLAYGVYGTGTVDVINILEECLEKLGLDVEKRPSRRLLKRINAFQEEVDIVDNVLLQQRKVLTDFSKCLDPAEFKRPTTVRKMRFKFEKSGIERILTHIGEQCRYCRELRDRAKVLEDQNVRLVETLADDNNRAILVFTLITIFFLPLSFVATFFGMNVVGINPTTSTTSHFWIIGAPLTGGISILCLTFVFKGEDAWYFLKDLPANCIELLRLRQRKSS